VAGIDGSFLGTDYKEGRICSWERHARGSKVVGPCRWRGVENQVFLSLSEHVNGPGTNDTVHGCGQDVVGIGGSDHADTVDWMGVAEVRTRLWSFLDGLSCPAR
jgi:hypothetical protein